jgi:hypothetical protein
MDFEMDGLVCELGVKRFTDTFKFHHGLASEHGNSKIRLKTQKSYLRTNGI